MSRPIYTMSALTKNGKDFPAKLVTFTENTISIDHGKRMPCKGWVASDSKSNRPIYIEARAGKDLYALYLEEEDAS